MGGIHRSLPGWVGVAVMLFAAVVPSPADDHEDRKHRRERHGRTEQSEGSGKAALITATDSTYAQTCGACHMPYAPALLPFASWKNIVGRTADHFGGESFELAPADQKAITAYLAANAADQRKTKLAGKIMNSLGGRIPVRITEVPYIKEKHRKRALVPDCSSCHKPKGSR